MLLTCCAAPRLSKRFMAGSAGCWHWGTRQLPQGNPWCIIEAHLHIFCIGGASLGNDACLFGQTYITSWKHQPIRLNSVGLSSFWVSESGVKIFDLTLGSVNTRKYSAPNHAWSGAMCPVISLVPFLKDTLTPRAVSSLLQSNCLVCHRHPKTSRKCTRLTGVCSVPWWDLTLTRSWVVLAWITCGSWLHIY